MPSENPPPGLTGLDWTGLDWTRFDWTGLAFARAQGHVKRDPSSKLAVSNSLGIPPSFYLLFTLKPTHIPTLVAANKKGRSPRPPDAKPRELLAWAKSENLVDWPKVS
jgi:hypothetical protein